MNYMPILTNYGKKLPSFYNNTCHSENGIHFQFLKIYLILLRYITFLSLYITFTKWTNLHSVYTATGRVPLFILKYLLFRSIHFYSNALYMKLRFQNRHKSKYIV